MRNELTAPSRRRTDRLSLREHGDWRQLSRLRRELIATASPGPKVRRTRVEIERVDRHGVVGYHLVSTSDTG